MHRNRCSYIDFVKIYFAIMIFLFHFGNGVLPGGRIAVEGYFMISGYLMMISINNDKEANIGVSTIKFIIHKYISFAKYLIPSVVISIIGRIMFDQISIADAIHKLPLVTFEVIPLYSLGFRGWYVIGISWYISSMFAGLAILYPICKKYHDRFILSIGWLIPLLLYGYFSAINKSMAVPIWKGEMGGMPLGLMRGIAGCLSGCVIYEIVNSVKSLKLNMNARIAIFFVELCGYAYIIYTAKFLAQSQYDFLLIFVIFILLIIGISGLSFSVNNKYSSILGILSTLIVLNHNQWSELLKFKYGGENLSYFPEYLFLTILSCLIVYLVSNTSRLLLVLKKHNINIILK